MSIIRIDFFSGREREREKPMEGQATAQDVSLTLTVAFFLEYMVCPLNSPKRDYKNKSRLSSSATSLDATLPSN